MVGKKKAPDDDLNHWRTEGNKLSGSTVSIEDRDKRVEQGVVVAVARRKDPLAQDGREDVYYRVIDLTENLIKSFKVRDATVTVDHTAQRHSTRAERNAFEKGVALYGGDKFGKQALSNGDLDGAEIKLWREVEGQWFEGVVADLIQHGQTIHTFTYTCTVLCKNGVQIPNIPLCESAWELIVDEANKPAETGGSGDDSRAKRRRKRVDVPNALGIFEGNIKPMTMSGRRNQVALGKPRVAKGQQGSARKGRQSMPSRPSSAATGDGAEPSGFRRGRRRASAADTPASRGRPSARGRKAAPAAARRGRSGARPASHSGEPDSVKEEGADDDSDAPFGDAEDDASSSHHTPASAAGQEGSQSQGSASAQSASASQKAPPESESESDVEDADAPTDEPVQRIRSKPGRGRGRGAARGGKRSGAAGRRRTRVSTGEPPADDAAEHEAGAVDDDRRGALKRRRGTQSPAAPGSEAPATAPRDAAATPDAPRGGQKAPKRSRREAAAGDDQLASAPDVLTPGARGRIPTKPQPNDARTSRQPGAPEQEPPSLDRPAADAAASHSTGAGAGMRQGSPHAVADAAAAGAISTAAADDAHAGEGGTASLPSGCGASAMSEDERRGDAGGGDSAAGDAGEAEAEESAEGRRSSAQGQAAAVSEDAHAAAVSRGKGAAASEVTHSEVTKDSVAVGSRGAHLRVPGLPMPVVSAPAHGDVGILSTRPVSHADTAGTASGGANGQLDWASGAGGEHGTEAAPVGAEDADEPSHGSGGAMEAADATADEGGVNAMEAGGGETLGRGARQAAWREAKKTAAEMDEAELAAEGAAAEQPPSDQMRSSKKRRGRPPGRPAAGERSPGSKQRGARAAAEAGAEQPEADPAPVASAGPPDAAMHADEAARASAEVSAEDVANAGATAEPDAGTDGSMPAEGGLGSPPPTAPLDGEGPQGPDAEEGPHAWLEASASAGQRALGSSGDQQGAGGEGVDAYGTEDVAEVAESEEQMLPRKRQKRPIKGKVMPQPPVALSSPTHGSPGEASSEGGRAAARRPLHSQAATMSRLRKAPAFAANGAGKQPSAAPPSGRRGGRGLAQVEVARSAPRSQPQPAKPPSQSRPQAGAGLRRSLGPQSLIAPSAAWKPNRFVRTRPGGGAQGGGSADGRDGAGGGAAAPRSPESPPSLLPPTSGAMALEDSAMCDAEDQFQDMEMSPREGTSPGAEVEHRTKAAQVADTLAEAAAVGAEAVAAAVTALVHPTDPVLEESALGTDRDAARAERVAPANFALAAQHVATNAVAAAEQAVHAALGEHMHDRPAGVADVGREAALEAAAAAADADADGRGTGVLGEPWPPAPLPTADKRCGATAVADVQEAPVLTQQPTVQSPMPPAEVLQRPGAPVRPDTAAARDVPSAGAAALARPHSGSPDAEPSVHRGGGGAADARDTPAAPSAYGSQPHAEKASGYWSSGILGGLRNLVPGLGRRTPSSRANSAAAPPAAAAAAPDAERPVDSQARDAAPPGAAAEVGPASGSARSREEPAAAPVAEDATAQPDADTGIPAGVVPANGGVPVEADVAARDEAMAGSETEDSSPPPADVAVEGRVEVDAAEAGDRSDTAAPLDSEMRDAPLMEEESPRGGPAQGSGHLRPLNGNGTQLLSSPPPSPVAQHDHAGKGLRPNDPIADDPTADDAIVGVPSEEMPPLVGMLDQPADMEVDDQAALDSIDGLSCSPRPQATGSREALGVFAQADAAPGGARGAGLVAATSLDLLRETVSNGAEARVQQRVSAPAAAAAAAGDAADAAPGAVAPAGGAAGAADGTALPAIRAKRTARAMPPPVTAPPPPATVPPRGSRKSRLKVVRGKKGDGAAPSAGRSSAQPNEGGTSSSAHFICTEGGGPCSGMERLAPLSDPRKLIPDDQAMGQRIGLGTTPAGPALVWEVDIDNVGDFSSSLQVASGERGAQLLMRRTGASAPQEEEAAKEPYRGNNGAVVPCGPAPTQDDILRAEQVAYTMLAPAGMKLETIASGGVRAEATPAPGIARLTFRLRDGSSLPPTT